MCCSLRLTSQPDCTDSDLDTPHCPQGKLTSYRTAVQTQPVLLDTVREERDEEIVCKGQRGSNPGGENKGIKGNDGKR